MVEQHGFSAHQYADDTQLYGWCRPVNSAPLCHDLGACVDGVALWMSSNRLQGIQSTRTQGQLVPSQLVPKLSRTHGQVVPKVDSYPSTIKSTKYMKVCTIELNEKRTLTRDIDIAILSVCPSVTFWYQMKTANISS